MKRRFLLSISSGFLLGLGWVEITGFFSLVFFALVPFLILEEEIYSKKLSSKKVYVHALIIFCLFNVITTWWIYHSTLPGALMAFFFSSILVAFPFWFFHLTRKFVGNKEGYIAFVINILAFEWIDYNWPLSHPWLPFGNVFAGSPDIVQWYEYTGVEGGSLWIILANLIVFFGYKNYKSGKTVKELKGLAIGLFALLFIPILISFVIKSNVDTGENNTKIEIVLVQPNVDPYTEKFDGSLTGTDQIEHILELAEQTITSNTDLIIAPETALPFSLEEKKLEQIEEIYRTREFLSNYPNAHLLTGASTHSFFKEKNSDASRKMANGNGYWEAYNTSLLIGLKDSIPTYHKMKLVLGVEKLPFQFITKPLESLFELGGISGTLGTEVSPKNFQIKDAVIAPTICYESIYGEFNSEFCKKGANIISVSTNDAWWYDTPGYKQLLAYTQLRAIENRKWIARSANTGISCFINPKGEIVQQTKWEEATSISMKVPLMPATTFYTNYGDYISRACVFIASLLLLLTFVKKIKGKNLNL